jgi:hypothetical protein
MRVSLLFLARTSLGIAIALLVVRSITHKSLLCKILSSKSGFLTDPETDPPKTLSGFLAV